MEKVIKGIHDARRYLEDREWVDKSVGVHIDALNDALALLKEQEKKPIKLHKKHVLTLKRNDEFTMRKLYESICEKLLDEGEMIITRTDDHEKVEFVFYVAGE